MKTKTVTAYQNSAGQLFANREDYVKSELSILFPATPDASTEKNVATLIQNAPQIIELLAYKKPRKPRSPNKPKSAPATAPQE